ncbi:serine hydrolase domain-containing protein [Amycolatopsis antarctica]|nr:serine hydrolase domain-containing protein [Amycolatopsis antarctica]
MSLSRLTGVLADLSTEHRIPGAQLAVRHRGETYSAVFGHTAYGTSEPVDWGSRFPFGSVSKSFTASVAMQLVADGDIDLDEPVDAHVPELRDIGCLHDVTLRQLLGHTSGLVSDHEIDGRQNTTLRRYVSSLQDSCKADSAGVAFSYSNTGYVLVGRLIECLTGMSWWDAVESFLAGPLGLTLTPAVLSDPMASIVTAHSVSAGRVVPVANVLPAAWEPAGGIAGTALDLLKFAEAHLDGGTNAILDRDLAELMRRPTGIEPFGVAHAWGLGWGLYLDSYQSMWAGHDGTLSGTTSALRFDPADGTIVALTTNATTGLALWADLVDKLAEMGIEVGDYGGRTVVQPGQWHDPAEYVGDYVNGTTCFRLRVDAQNLLSLDDGTGFVASLTVAGPDTFLVHQKDVSTPSHPARFLRDSVTGRIRSMQFSGRMSSFRTSINNVERIPVGI